jgi:pyrroloquinoline quinone biosynthesis protein B
MHLGREAVGARAIPVYLMPRLFEFLQENGPWSQLVRLKNVELRPLRSDVPIRLGDQLEVRPLPVPHRDEYSETVGFIIDGPESSVLFIPDIDKWERWNRPLESVLARVDRAYVDGTFFSSGELGDRAMSEIPHPFIEETLARIGPLAAPERAKVRFIHLNHTNPALDDASEATARIQAAGAGVAVEGERFEL